MAQVLGPQGRQAPLPFVFEGVLEDLQQEHIQSLTEGLKRYQQLWAGEVRYGGKQPPEQWSYVCPAVAKGGLFELALEVMNYSNPQEWPFEFHLKAVAYVTAMVAWAGADEYAPFLTKHLDTLGKRLAGGTRLSVEGTSFVLNFDLSPPGRPQGLTGPSGVGFWFRSILSDLEKYSSRLRNPVSAFTETEVMRKVHGGMSETVKYLEEFWGPKALPPEEQVKRWKDRLKKELEGRDLKDVLADISPGTETGRKIIELEGQTIRNLFSNPPGSNPA